MNALHETEPDLLYRLTGKSTGITRLEDGRYGFVCGKHQLMRLATSADPKDLQGFTCRECDAHREAAPERRRLMEVIYGL